MPLSSDRHIVDDQFKKQLNHYKVQPSGKVWNRLSGDLHLQDNKSNNGKRMLLLVLLLLLGSGGIWLTTNIQAVKKNTSEVVLADGSGKKVVIQSDVSTDKMTTSAYSASATSIPETMSINNPTAANSTFSAPVYEMDFYELLVSDWNASDNVIMDKNGAVPFSWTSENSVMEPLVTMQNLSPEEGNAVLKMQRTQGLPYPAISKNPDFYMASAAGFYFGFGETFNTTLIIDRKAFSDENLKFSPTFGTALMIHGGYNFSNKWGMEGAWVIHSQEGQRYKYLPTDNRTTSLELNQKHISFNYMKFPVMVKYKIQGWSGITETPFFVNYSLGLQYGRLMSYSVDETKERVSEQNLFRKDEYSVVAGLDYDFITKKASFFTVGIHTSVGSDLFVKDTPEYLEFDRPHNFLIGLHGAVSFSLKKMPRNRSL